MGKLLNDVIRSHEEAAERKLGAKFLVTDVTNNIRYVKRGLTSGAYERAKNGCGGLTKILEKYI
jgi:hypothetical protein